MAVPPSFTSSWLPSRRMAHHATIIFFIAMINHILLSEALMKREYHIEDIQGNRLQDMADARRRCKAKFNGDVPIADSAVKDAEIMTYMDKCVTDKLITLTARVALGGSLSISSSNGNGVSPHRWCWDYGTGDCGPNNELLIGTGDSPVFQAHEGMYVKWGVGYPKYNGVIFKYIIYSHQLRAWITFKTEEIDHLLCVSEKDVPDSTPSPTEDKAQSLWWIALIVVGVVLLIVILIVAVVCCRKCKQKAYNENEFPSEDEYSSSSMRGSQGYLSRSSSAVSMRSMSTR